MVPTVRRHRAIYLNYPSTLRRLYECECDPVFPGVPNAKVFRIEKKMNAATTRSVTIFFAVLIIPDRHCDRPVQEMRANRRRDSNRPRRDGRQQQMGNATGDLKGAVGVKILNTEASSKIPKSCSSSLYSTQIMGGS